MIEEKDLPFLILIEEKLIEVNNDAKPISIGNFKDCFESQSHFINIAKILVEHNLAKEPKGLLPNRYAIIKTEKTGYKRIQDIFNSEQEDKRKKDIEFKAIATDLKSKNWYSLQNLLTIVSTLFAVLTFLYALNSDEEKNEYKSKIQSQQATIEKLISEKDSLQNRLSIQSEKNGIIVK